MYWGESCRARELLVEVRKSVQSKSGVRELRTGNKGDFPIDGMLFAYAEHARKISRYYPLRVILCVEFGEEQHVW